MCCVAVASMCDMTWNKAVGRWRFVAFTACIVPRSGLLSHSATG